MGLPKTVNLKARRGSRTAYSTLCALTNARSVIDAGTVLIFDEFIVNSDWEQDEYRALNEFCENHGVTYEVLAVSLFTKQMVCKVHV
jgi:hypothetical protein